MHKVLDQPVVILSAARTPIGRFDGILRSYGAVDLGARVVREVVARAKMEPQLIEQVIMGNVVGAGLGEAPAKQVAVMAGLPEDVIAKTVNAVCGSGLEAVIEATNAILLGTIEIAIAGGMESRSTAPYLLGPFHKDGTRIQCKLAAYRLMEIEGDLEDKIKKRDIIVKEATRYDGLFWPLEQKFMAEYAVMFAQKRGYSADFINKYAAESHRKAKEATEKGLFKEEIVPVDGIDQDDLLPEEKQKEILISKPDDLASLYNASSPADGAAALLIASGKKAEKLNLSPLATIKGYAVTSCGPANFLDAPVRVVNELLEALRKTGYETNFTIIEANEAFASQSPLFEENFKGMLINPHGGTVALGHPLGAGGARILVTLLYAMKRYDHKKGLATICFGSGGAYAIALEK